MKPSLSLRASLSLAMVGLALVVALGAVALHTGLALRATVEASALRARTFAREAAVLAARAASGGSQEDASQAISRDLLLDGLFRSALASDPTLVDLGVFDDAGRVLAHSQSGLTGTVQDRRPSLEGLTERSLLAQAVRLLGRPRAYEEVVPLRAGEASFGEVRVGVSTALLRAQLLDSLAAGLWVAVISLALAMVLALVFAQLLARRVRRVTAGLERLSEGEFGYRLQVEGQDELARLASSINELAERLEGARLRAAMGRLDHDEFLDATGEMAEWARFASGLAHEMADPLNAAALHLGHLKRRLERPTAEAARHLQVLEDELKRLEHIIVGFRRFAMLGEMRARWFDPKELLTELAGRASEMLRERRSRMQVEAAGLPARFWGDPILIQQALVNLVANADQAMPGGGDITLAARASAETLEIEVLDRGDGVPEAIRERIFDPYFTTRREGSGIGLSVVQQVARLHGGDVRVLPRAHGGTRVTLRLPVRRVDAREPKPELQSAPLVLLVAPLSLAAVLMFVPGCAVFGRNSSAEPRTPRATQTAAAVDTARAERIKVEGVLGEAERSALMARVVSDTTEAGKLVRGCRGKLSAEQQAAIESTLGLLIETRQALEREELWRAESLAKKARQLAASLACS